MDNERLREVRGKMKKLMGILFAALVVLTLGVGAVSAGTGNGAPSGAHYNLNIIGVPKDKSADMTDNSGHRIFMPLEGQSKIYLFESAGLGEYTVLDANGTDGRAEFSLPNPDPTNSGTTRYSVFARAVGKPGGSASMVTMATWEGPDGILGTADDEPVTSLAVLEVERGKGKVGSFENVSKYLLYVYADVDGDGVVERVPLFDEDFQDFLWQYDNNGLKVLQLRFYEIPTTVPGTYPF